MGCTGYRVGAGGRVVLSHAILETYQCQPAHMSGLQVVRVTWGDEEVPLAGWLFGLRLV